MPQRSKQFYDQLGNRSILQLALDVHMTTTGATEDNPYSKPMGLSVAGKTPEQRERDQKACDWYKGFIDAYAE